MTYDFQIKNVKIKLLMEYESLTQKYLFDNDVLPILMSGREYEFIPQIGDCSRESNVCTLVLRNKVHYPNAMSTI
jgi:hypothetical protein